jgi:hypothetical protein
MWNGDFTASQYAVGNYGLQGNQAIAQNQLQSALKFDPNAYIETVPGTTYSNETGQGQNPDQYVVHFDPSKAPQGQIATNPQALAAEHAALSSAKYQNELQPFDTSDPSWSNKSQYGAHTWLADPSAVFGDPTGNYTAAGNIKHMYSGDGSFGDKFANSYAPIIMSSLMSFGGAPALMGALFSAGQGMVNNGKVNLPALGASLAGSALGGGIPGISGIGSSIPGLSDVMKYLNLAKGGYGIFNQLQHGNNVGAGASTIGELAGLSKLFGGGS